jgi:NADH-quinone oxidoreductase subunit E
MDNQTPQSAVAMVDDLREGKDIKPSRGPDKVHTFKEVSRVLAGFNDGHADEGVGAGPASIRGTVIARENGWIGTDAASHPAQTPQNDEVAPETGDEGSSAQRPADEGADK